MGLQAVMLSERDQGHVTHSQGQSLVHLFNGTLFHPAQVPAKTLTRLILPIFAYIMKSRGPFCLTGFQGLKLVFREQAVA